MNTDGATAVNANVETLSWIASFATMKTGHSMLGNKAAVGIVAASIMNNVGSHDRITKRYNTIPRLTFNIYLKNKTIELIKRAPSIDKKIFVIRRVRMNSGITYEIRKKRTKQTSIQLLTVCFYVKPVNNCII